MKNSASLTRWFCRTHIVDIFWRRNKKAKKKAFWKQIYSRYNLWILEKSHFSLTIATFGVAKKVANFLKINGQKRFKTTSSGLLRRCNFCWECFPQFTRKGSEPKSKGSVDEKNCDEVVFENWKQPLFSFVFRACSRKIPKLNGSADHWSPKLLLSDHCHQVRLKNIFTHGKKGLSLRRKLIQFQNCQSRCTLGKNCTNNKSSLVFFSSWSC